MDEKRTSKIRRYEAEISGQGSEVRKVRKREIRKEGIRIKG
jgi:hypothetical protein